MAAKLYTDVDWATLLAFETPQRNQCDHISFSVHCSRIRKIQLGEHDDFQKNEIVQVFGEKGCEMACSKHIMAWIRELEKQVLLVVEKNSLEWFGSKMNKEDLGTIFKPTVFSNDSVVLRFEQNMRVFHMNKAGTQVKRAQRALIDHGKLTLPIIRIKGLWIEEESFGLCVSVSDLLVFEEQTDDNPFQGDQEELHSENFQHRPPSPVESFLSHGRSLHGDDFCFEK